MSKTPTAPKGIGVGGRKLWRDITSKYELEQHELTLLTEAVRTVDQLDKLDAVVADEGVVLDGKVHPGVVEQRQLRIVLTRLLASLRLPAGDEDEPGGRPQRRGAARQPYTRGIGALPE